MFNSLKVPRFPFLHLLSLRVRVLLILPRLCFVSIKASYVFFCFFLLIFFLCVVVFVCVYASSVVSNESNVRKYTSNIHHVSSKVVDVHISLRLSARFPSSYFAVLIGQIQEVHYHLKTHTYSNVPAAEKCIRLIRLSVSRRSFRTCECLFSFKIKYHSEQVWCGVVCVISSDLFCFVLRYNH